MTSVFLDFKMGRYKLKCSRNLDLHIMQRADTDRTDLLFSWKLMLNDRNLQIAEVLLTLTLLFGFSRGLRGRFFKGRLRCPKEGSGFGFIEEVELL